MVIERKTSLKGTVADKVVKETANNKGTEEKAARQAVLKREAEEGEAVKVLLLNKLPKRRLLG